MKYAIIVLLAVGLGCLASNAWAGEKEIGTRTFIVPTPWRRSVEIVKFVDPDNGNVCYLSADPYANGSYISCVHK